MALLGKGLGGKAGDGWSQRGWGRVSSLTLVSTEAQNAQQGLRQHVLPLKRLLTPSAKGTQRLRLKRATVSQNENTPSWIESTSEGPLVETVLLSILTPNSGKMYTATFF